MNTRNISTEAAPTTFTPKQNRQQRRSEKYQREGLLNNRKQTKGRKHPHRVLERMAYFSLSVHAKINKLV